jgi:hypothetical protein
MFHFSRISFLTLLIAILLPGYSLALDKQAVLDQLVETYGGESSLRKMDNMVQEWDMVAMMGNRHGTDTRSIRSPGQLRVVLNYPEKSETRILNDNAAWAIFGNAPAEAVSGIQLDAMRLQLMRLYSPLMLRDKIDSVNLVEDGGQLALSLVENGVHAFYLVNKDNWHIEKVAGSLMMQGSEIQFLTVYSDFDVVDGVLVHRAENKFAGGMNTAKLTLKKITFDTKLDDGLFKPLSHGGLKN